MHKRKHTGMVASVRQNIIQETPLPTYIGLMLHAHTRKRELVDRLHYLGLSISYDRVHLLSTQLGMEYMSALKGKRWSVHQSFVEKYLHLLQLTTLTTIRLQQLLRIHFMELRSPCSSILVLLGKVRGCTPGTAGAAIEVPLFKIPALLCHLYLFEIKQFIDN